MDNHSLIKGPRDSFKARADSRWMEGLDQKQWVLRTRERVNGLEHQFSGEPKPRILLLQPDPVEFLASFMAACITGCPIFLGNPQWGELERQQAQTIAKPHLLWSAEGEIALDEPSELSPAEGGWIMIPTGGTSGQIKFAIHSWSSLVAAVKGMQDFFGESDANFQINSCCVLPLYHVSGLMQFMRSLLTGGQLMVMPFRAFQSGISDQVEVAEFLDVTSPQPQSFFLSLVPTQLYRLMEGCDRLEWLARFQTILLGGAPATPSLLNRAQDLGLKVAPTYGMTETAAQVMTLKPDDFLAGHRSTGAVLPHVQMALVSEQKVGIGDRTSIQVGCLQWSGPSVFRGYYPHLNDQQLYLSDDMAERNATGQIRILGRSSRKIISGGENIFPEEVERLLMETQCLKDVYVLGLPDVEWGEALTAVYVSKDGQKIDVKLQSHLRQQLSSYKCPKQWVSLPEIPRNPQGKVNVEALKTLVLSLEQ